MLQNGFLQQLIHSAIPMPFPWYHPSHQTQPSPPASPSAYLGNSWPQRVQSAGGIPNFTIDAILSHHRQNQQQQQQHHHQLKKSENLPHHTSGDARVQRSTPYPSVSTVGEVHGSIRHSSGTNPSGGGGGGKSKAKRIRTIFTAEQLERLEAEFLRQQYMVGPERVYLASTLHLSEAQVKVWFQNRRIKWRKQYMESQQVKYHDVNDSPVSRSPPPSPDHGGVRSKASAEAEAAGEAPSNTKQELSISNGASEQPQGSRSSSPTGSSETSSTPPSSPSSPSSPGSGEGRHLGEKASVFSSSVNGLPINFSNNNKNNISNINNNVDTNDCVVTNTSDLSKYINVNQLKNSLLSVQEELLKAQLARPFSRT